jgi:hypothetical protein
MSDRRGLQNALTALDEVWCSALAKVLDNSAAMVGGGVTDDDVEAFRATLDKDRDRVLGRASLDVQAVARATYRYHAIRSLFVCLLALSAALLPAFLLAVASHLQPNSFAWIVVELYVLIAVVAVISLAVARDTQRAATLDLASSLYPLLEPELRSVINHWLRTPSGQVNVRSTHGLSERFNEPLAISTGSLRAAQRIMRTMDGASIGLAGPRGAGKSALMASLLNGDFRPQGSGVVGVLVRAPVRYDTSDFIKHLFMTLCLNVLRGEDPDEDAPLSGSHRNRWLPPLVALLLLAAGEITLAFGPPGSWAFPRHPSVFISWLLITAGGVVAVIWLGDVLRRAWAARHRTTRGPAGPDPYRFARLARRRLHELRHLDTRTVGLTAGTGSSSLISLSGTRSMESARQGFSLPELVARYLEFTAAAVANGNSVIVGIDELDRMDSDDEARRFLNDIKGLFGQPGCYYVASVSEDAMSAFERRGMPYRDVFDSAFDTVLYIAPLTPAESARLLSRRVIGFGAGAHLICYALSGGLPRDLIRVARDLSIQARGRETTNVADLAWPLVRARVRIAEEAAGTVARRSVLPDGTQPLLQFLHEDLPTLDGPDSLRARYGIAGLLDKVKGCGLAADDRDELTLVALQLATLAYHVETVIQALRGLTPADLDELGDAIELTVDSNVAGGRHRTACCLAETCPGEARDARRPRPCVEHCVERQADG